MNEFKFADLKVDQKENFDVTISETMMNSFREISGDVNPLHFDKNFAKRNNYKDIVVFGLLISSFYQGWLGIPENTPF